MCFVMYSSKASAEYFFDVGVFILFVLFARDPFFAESVKTGFAFFFQPIGFSRESFVQQRFELRFELGGDDDFFIEHYGHYLRSLFYLGGVWILAAGFWLDPSSDHSSESARSQRLAS